MPAAVMARVVLVLRPVRITGLHIARCLTVALAFSAASTARAADPDTERARALYDEAGELERRGQWGVAQEKLRTALRLRETPQLRFALGWALENDDKLLEAKVEYETATRSARGVPGAEEAARLASARLADLVDRTPGIKVKIGGAPRRSVRVIVDGHELDRDEDSPTTAVNPGSHVVRVERASDGAGLAEQVVYVGRGTVRTVDVEVADAVTQRNSAQDRHEGAPVTATVHTSTTQSRSVVPWILLSGGIAGLVGGAALLVSSSSDAETRDDMRGRWCTATACRGTTATIPESAQAASYRQASTDAAHDGNVKQAFGFVLGGAGLVATTVGAVMLIRASDRPRENAASPPRVRASVTPTFGGGFASAAISF